MSISTSTLAVRQIHALSPVSQVQRLNPYRVHHLPAFGKNPAMVVAEFWRIGAKPGSSMRVLEDKSVKRQCGDITIRSDGKFNISYFPDPSMGEPVSAVGVDIKELPRAIEDLIAAGFGPQPSPSIPVTYDIPPVTQSFSSVNLDVPRLTQ